MIYCVNYIPCLANLQYFIALKGDILYNYYINIIGDIMKRVFVITIVFIFTFLSCFGINALLERSNAVHSGYIKSKYNIVLDAGHGGADAGTIAADGTLEKDINLAIVLNLYDFLRFCGINCYTIRNTDDEYYPNGLDRSKSDLYNRLDYVNGIDNAVLVSIHQNHYTDSAEWGMQVWYTENDKTSNLLADEILYISKKFLQPENKRFNKPSGSSYYILYKASVPSVMVECGFMSNTDENSKLKSDKYQKELAYCITMGINTYLYKDINGENNG